jgi:hypothetical protein
MPRAALIDAPGFRQAGVHARAHRRFKSFRWSCLGPGEGIGARRGYTDRRAPVAQWIEQRFPKPRAQVRLLPGVSPLSMRNPAPGVGLRPLRERSHSPLNTARNRSVVGRTGAQLGRISALDLREPRSRVRAVEVGVERLPRLALVAFEEVAVPLGHVGGRVPRIVTDPLQREPGRVHERDV